MSVFRKTKHERMIEELKERFVNLLATSKSRELKSSSDGQKRFDLFILDEYKKLK